MTHSLPLLAAPVAAIVVGAGLGLAGAPRRVVVWAGIAAGVGTAALAVAIAITSFGECWSENRERPFSWPWSPRRKFCNDEGSLAAQGIYALLPIPALAVALCAYLYAKSRKLVVLPALAVTLAVPVLPAAYVEALPVYELDEYPVLHDPLLRPGSAAGPPRVCYLDGLAHGPNRVDSDLPRTCVDLKPTPRAMALRGQYDGGRTIFSLELVGTELTRKGRPVRPGPTGVAGLEVMRVYTLSDRDARIGAAAIN